MRLRSTFLTVALAVVAVNLSPPDLAMASAAMAQERALPRPVSLDIVWPASGVERVDGNGLSLDGGVAGVDGSDQYGLASLSVDEAQSIVRFTYVDAWTLTAARPASCTLTYRGVERALTQGEANTLSDTLATAEFQAIKGAHSDLVKVGERVREGSAVVRQVDRFTYGGADAMTQGLSKSWVFVRLGKAYYVNKICLAPDDEAGLTVIDQLVGLNYRTGDAAVALSPSVDRAPVTPAESATEGPAVAIAPDANVNQPAPAEPVATEASEPDAGFATSDAASTEPIAAAAVPVPAIADSADAAPIATPASAPEGATASATRSLNQASPTR